MLLTPRFPPLDIPTTGLIPYLFDNPCNISDDKKVFIDVHSNAALTFGQVKDGVLQLAAGLQDVYGFGDGDVLALFAPNSIDFAVPALGAVAAGGAVSPSNPRYSVTELTHQLELSGAKVLVAHEENIAVALASAEQVGLPKRNILLMGDKVIDGVLPYKSVLMRQTRRVVVAPLSAEEARTKVCYLCFSSGTTGKSKGVMTSHTNAVAAAHAYMEVEGMNDPNVANRRGLNFLPMFHMFALLIVMHISFRRGTPMYIMDHFDMTLFMQTLQDKQISSVWCVPPIILALVKHPQVLQYDLSALRFVYSAAAPLSKELSEEFSTKFPKVSISQGYGMTETSPLATMELLGETAHGSCGVLIHNMVARLVKDDGTDARGNESGELWLKGPNIMLGYIKNKEATAETLDKDGFLHTGDVAVVDEKGRFYIVDRIKELIKYKGFQVPPAELEGILLKSPLVSDCAVIGVYDPVQATEVPRAYVALQAGIDTSEKTAKDLMAFVAGQVASFKQIRQIRFTDAVPKSASGKILRRVLRDQVKEEEKNAKPLPAKL